jgi:hypothetical protein
LLSPSDQAIAPVQPEHAKGFQRVRQPGQSGRIAPARPATAS